MFLEEHATNVGLEQQRSLMDPWKALSALRRSLLLEGELREDDKDLPRRNIRKTSFCQQSWIRSTRVDLKKSYGAFEGSLSSISQRG
jgi:hypothetical protein